jgi:hypothetical protein
MKGFRGITGFENGMTTNKLVKFVSTHRPPAKYTIDSVWEVKVMKAYNYLPTSMILSRINLGFVKTMKRKKIFRSVSEIEILGLRLLGV